MWLTFSGQRSRVLLNTLPGHRTASSVETHPDSNATGAKMEQHNHSWSSPCALVNPEPALFPRFTNLGEVLRTWGRWRNFENVRVLVSTRPSLIDITGRCHCSQNWFLKKPALESALEISEHWSGYSYVKTPHLDDYSLSCHLPSPQHKPWGQGHPVAAPLASPRLPPHLLPDSHASPSVLPTVPHIGPYFWPFLLFTYLVFHFLFLYL